MRVSHFVSGLVVGLALGGAGTAIALPATPKMVGSAGYLTNYDVLDQDGETICSEPFVWTGTREIQCESDDR